MFLKMFLFFKEKLILGKYYIEIEKNYPKNTEYSSTKANENKKGIFFMKLTLIATTFCYKKTRTIKKNST